MKYLILISLFFVACNNSETKTDTNPNIENVVTPKQEALISEHISASDTSPFLTFTCDPKDVQLFWKSNEDSIFKSFEILDKWVSKQNTNLRFAMNAGMYMEDNSPLGLYIENGKILKALNKNNGTGNFYLKSNGVFAISNNGKAILQVRDDFKSNDIKFATQSGPMLLVNGMINTLFTEGSSNLNIRNGVGILPNGDCFFVMSKDAVNFYDFAKYFKEQGCKNALYLDGAISRTYLPEKGYTDLYGNFGVMIAVLQSK